MSNRWVSASPSWFATQTSAGQCMARGFDPPVAEVQVRVSGFIGCSALGIPVTKVGGVVCPAEGAVRPSADGATQPNDIRMRLAEKWLVPW